MSFASSRVFSIQRDLNSIPSQSQKGVQEKKPKKVQKEKEIKENNQKKNDIDDIFAQLKTKPRKKDIEQQKEEERKERLQRKKEENKKIKRTEEGWRIYTLEELGLDKNQYGGNTPLCPFDCDCCH